MNDTSTTAINVDQELYPALIQCFFIIGAGYIAGQLNLLTSTQAAGLSRYIGNFALPAVVFKNLVDIQFASVSWGFLGSVLIAKAFVFFSTALITVFGVRPRNYASVGLHAIMTSQSNDFALMAPIINAVYKDSHPDYQRYLYLVAPISLVMLNPIGIFLIEIQNRLDDRRKNPNASTESRWKLIRKILLNIIKNPIVICTILGVIFNRIFHEQLPNILERILTPIAQSFSATALFYLGITMVGKLRQFHTSLIITVLLLSMMKLIVCPLILRQAVYLLVKPSNGSLRNVIDFSDFGFLFGTAPTAPSIIFYIPDTNAALQAVASTGLVVVTILAGPIMLISAKMINLRSLDTNVTQVYETDLQRTGYDVSIISLFCTIIVLIGFCVRRRLLQISFIHKYTFIFVGIQLVHAIWTIGVEFVKQPITDAAATVVSLGTTFTQLSTRSWAASLSIALMISICYSVERARRYFWVYHLYGWILPIIATGIIYLLSKLAKPKEDPMLRSKRLQKISSSVIIFTLVICITVILVSLLRFVRRTYRVNRIEQEHCQTNILNNETQPLLQDESEIENSQRAIPSSIPSTMKRSHINAQSLRHAILVGVMCINMVICTLALLWSIAVSDRDGIYYELEFFDVVFMHGQGIVTFLVFALDAELLLPISRRVMKLLKYFGLKMKCRARNRSQRSTSSDVSNKFEDDIRPSFIRYAISMRSMSDSSESNERIFNKIEFCQWLVSNGHVENESQAQNYCQELETNKQIICINRTPATDQSIHWYAFSK